jgi:hypothetical protein
LKKGDHYILVMWGGASTVGVVIGLACVIAYFGIRLGVNWIENAFAPPNPHIMLGIFLIGITVINVFQRQLSAAFDWIIEHTIGRFIDSKGREEE